jgi:hypothetical protein
VSKNPYCTYKREQALEQALCALESKGLTATWANIGAELGITRQGAQQRFADIHAPSPADSLSDALMSHLVGVDTTHMTLDHIKRTFAPEAMTRHAVFLAMTRMALPYVHVDVTPSAKASLLHALKEVDTAELTILELTAKCKPAGMKTQTFRSYLHSQLFRTAHGIAIKRIRSAKDEPVRIALRGIRFLHSIQGHDLTGMTPSEVIAKYLPEGDNPDYLRQLLNNEEFRKHNNLNLTIKSRRPK